MRCATSPQTPSVSSCCPCLRAPKAEPVCASAASRFLRCPRCVCPRREIEQLQQQLQHIKPILAEADQERTELRRKYVDLGKKMEVLIREEAETKQLLDAELLDARRMVEKAQEDARRIVEETRGDARRKVTLLKPLLFLLGGCCCCCSCFAFAILLLLLLLLFALLLPSSPSSCSWCCFSSPLPFCFCCSSFPLFLSLLLVLRVTAPAAASVCFFFMLWALRVVAC